MPSPLLYTLNAFLIPLVVILALVLMLRLVSARRGPVTPLMDQADAEDDQQTKEAV